MSEPQNSKATCSPKSAWNKGKLVGAKPPLQPKHVWAKASLLAVRGRLQREGRVTHVVAEELIDMTDRLAALKPGPVMSPEQARADEVKRPTRDHRPDLHRHLRDVTPMPRSRDFH